MSNTLNLIFPPPPGTVDWATYLRSSGGLGVRSFGLKVSFLRKLAAWVVAAIACDVFEEVAGAGFG